jgi:hypothetical protein
MRRVSRTSEAGAELLGRPQRSDLLGAFVKLAMPALCLAAAGSLLFVGAADAAKKPPPVCNLLTDSPDDAKSSIAKDGTYPTNLDATDIVSGDIATDTKNLTTVLRVKKLATTATDAPGGLHWKFFFNDGGTNVWTQAVAPTAGAVVFRYGQIDPVTGSSASLGTVTGVIDTAKNEVRVTVPMQSLPVPLKAGTKIDTLAPNAGRYFSAGVSYSEPTDAATSEKTYTVGALSCVKPGA